MKNVTDQLETLILMALDANHEQSGLEKTLQLSGQLIDIIDQGILLKFDDMRPESAYTFDASDDERIYARGSEYLMEHPAEVLGDFTEVLMLNDEILKWYGFRRLRAPPKGVCCLGKASHWYEIHMRFMTQNGRGKYFKRAVPLDKTGAPLLAKIGGHVICAPAFEGEHLILCASVIEDAHRANTMLAAVKDATEIKFPVPLDDYKDMFAERDGPMNGARRKAIVHWVARHLRHSTRGNEFAVKKHTRGVQEFTIDGLRIRLTPTHKQPARAELEAK